MKTKIAALFWLSLLVAVVLHARAADVDAARQYTGTVVDDKGQPVAGATVDCYQSQSRSGFGFWGDREPEFQQTTVTDGKGVFSVSASADAALVVIKKAGLATVWKNWRPQIPDSTDPIVLTAPATLSGVVTDNAGNPVAGALVWVAGASIGDGYDLAAQLNELQGQAARSCFSARTGSDGKFRIENFPADGRAGLAVSKSGMAQHMLGNDFAGQGDCQPGQDLKLVVGPAGSVEGKVIVAETGQPLGGVKIKLDNAESGVFDADYTESVESRADGTFRVTNAQPGKHFIRASIAGGPMPDWVRVPEDSQVTVVAGETARDVVVHYSKGAMVEVAVVVTNELTPVANAAVSAGGLTASTDANGVALLRVPAGTNWFSARKDWLAQNKTAGVEAGLTNHMRFELTAPPRINGTVHDASGVPTAGVLVSFHPGQYPNAPDYAEATTDENGQYEIRLKLSRETMGWFGSTTTTNCVMARDLMRNLAAIQEFGTSPTNFSFMGMEMIPTNLDLTLQPGITLSGSVKDTEGAPVTNATVDISVQIGNSISKLWPRPVKVDAQGSFSYPALPQGRTYEFWQGINAKGYGTAYARLKAEDSKTNHYDFPAFVLKRADRQLAGQVLGRDGKPVVGARVSMSGQGQLMFREARSDGQGHFNFDGVCAGEVRVNARYDSSPDHKNSEQGDVSAQGGDTNVVVRLGIYAGNTGGNLSPPIKTSGTVRDARGQPVAGVKVFMSDLQSASIGSQTDSRGQYEFTWQKRLNNEEDHWLLARDLSSGSAAFHQMDAAATNLDLALQEGLTLSVQVSDTDGRRLTNATATVGLRLGNKGFGVDSQPFTADEHGQLRIAALPQGERYMIQIHAPGHTSYMRMIEAGETGIKLLELPPVVLTAMDRDVAGRVLDNDGKPAVGVSVHLFQGGGQTTTTDADGRFIFRGVPPGLVSFDAGLPQPGTSAYKNSGMAQAKGGDTNIVIRLGTNPDPGASISVARITMSGTVFDPSGKPAPGVLLAMLPSGGLRTPAQSDANGKYTLQWQALFLRVTSSTKPIILARDPAHNLAATGEIDTNAPSLDLHLQPGLTLAGAVQDADGRQVTNAIVQLVPFPPDDKRATINQMAPTNASPEGLYFFSALPQGVPYRVNVSAVGYGPGTSTASAADTKTGQFRLPAVVLKHANQQVAGRVIGSDGKPGWGAEVTVSGDGQPAGRTTHSDANGHFVITEICDGPVNVRAVLSASAGNTRSLVGTVQTQGGDTNAVVKLAGR